MSTSDLQIRVHFVSETPEYQVPTSEITLPVSFKRRDLSALINQLLNLSPSIPFDFLVKDRLLRSSLEFLLRQQQESLESLFVISYRPRSPAPDPVESLLVPNWVSCVSSSGEVLCVGDYDAKMRLYRGSEVVLEYGVSSEVKSCSVQVQSSLVLVASAQLDRSLSVACLAAPLASSSSSSSSSSSTLQTLDPVTGAVRWNPSEPILACGAPEGICCYKTLSVEGSAAGSPPYIVFIPIDGRAAAPMTLLKPSDSPTCAPIPAMEWVSASVLCTGSYGHTLTLWDITTSSDVYNTRFNHPVLCVASQRESQLLLTGHTDSNLFLCDPRKSSRSQSFRGHVGYVSSLQWSPTSSFSFFSTGFDGSLREWDTRSSVPVHTVAASHEGKVFCSVFYEDLLCTGGEDCKLNRYRV